MHIVCVVNKQSDIPYLLFNVRQITLQISSIPTVSRNEHMRHLGYDRYYRRTNIWYRKSGQLLHIVSVIYSIFWFSYTFLIALNKTQLTSLYLLNRSSDKKTTTWNESPALRPNQTPTDLTLLPWVLSTQMSQRMPHMLVSRISKYIDRYRSVKLSADLNDIFSGQLLL